MYIFSFHPLHVKVQSLVLYKIGKSKGSLLLDQLT